MSIRMISHRQTIFCYKANNNCFCHLILSFMIDSKDWEVDRKELFDSFFEQAVYPIRMTWTGKVKIPFQDNREINIEFGNVSSRDEMIQILERLVDGLGYTNYWID